MSGWSRRTPSGSCLTSSARGPCTSCRAKTKGYVATEEASPASLGCEDVRAAVVVGRSVGTDLFFWYCYNVNDSDGYGVLVL